MESDSDSDEFFDADNEPESVVLASPSVSVPLTDEDPSDIEEDAELKEENDTSSEYMVLSSVCVFIEPGLTTLTPLSYQVVWPRTRVLLCTCSHK